jgi:hypothetical protein
MADEIEYEVKVDTSEVKQAENAFTRFTNKASQAFSGLGGKLKDVGDKFGELPGVVGNASTSLMGLGRSMLALVANPIGAVIAALVGIFVALKESLSKTEDGMDAVARVTGAFSALVKPLVETVSSLAVVLVDGLGAALEMVSSLFGGAADEGRKLADLNDQLEDQEIALAELRANQNKQLAQARELLSDSNAALGDRKKALDQVRKSETDLASKELKFAQDRLKAAKLDQQLNGATEASKKAISEATIGVANAETELAAKRRLFNREEKKLNAEAEQAAKERAAKAKEYTDQRTSAAKDIRSAEQANYLAGIQDDKKRSEEQARLEKENAIREINAGEYTIKEKNRLKKAAEEKYQLDLTKIAEDAEKKRQEDAKANLEKANQEKLAAIDEGFALEQLKATQTIKNEKDLQSALQQLEIDRLNTQIAERKKMGQSTTDLELTLANKRIDIAKNEEAQKKDLAQKEFDTKMALYEATSNALGAIGNAIGEETAAAKGLAIAGAIIDTYAGATKALSEGAGTPLGYINAAAIIATGFANVRKMTATPIPGANDTSSSAPSMGPSVSIVGGSADPSAQLAKSLASQQQKPIKAYTVATDMSTQQALDRRIQQNATFPG